MLRRRDIALLLAGSLCKTLWARATPESETSRWQELLAEIRSIYPSVRQISVSELATRLSVGARVKPILIDTRPSVEFDDGHLPNALRAETTPQALIALQGMPKSVAVVFYCSVGYRSSAIARALQDKGYSNVSNLEGSIFAWANAGGHTVATNGPNGRVHPFNAKWGTLLKRDLWSRPV